MATAHDFAAYLIEERPDELTQIQLHKLLYFVQAANLVWLGRPAFEEEIQAWKHGPVVPKVYYKDAGKDPIREPLRGSSSELSQEDRYVAERILKLLGDQSAGALRKLSHMTGPWKEARTDVPLGEGSSEVITPEAIAEWHGRAGVLPPGEMTDEEREIALRIAAGDHDAIGELIATLT